MPPSSFKQKGCALQLMLHSHGQCVMCRIVSERESFLRALDMRHSKLAPKQGCVEMNIKVTTIVGTMDDGDQRSRKDKSTLHADVAIEEGMHASTTHFHGNVKTG